MQIMVIVFCALFFPAVAQAYLGAEVGLSSIGNLIAIAGVIMVGGLGIIFWPIVVMMDWLKKKIKPAKKSEDSSEQNESL